LPNFDETKLEKGVMCKMFVDKNQFSKNVKLFKDFKKLNLPIGQYAITSSGPMGIRGIREIGDIDIVCTQKLWDELMVKGEPFDENGIAKIRIAPNIEALGEGSFYSDYFEDAPSVDEQIKQCEIIDGLPFVRLKTIIYFKEKVGRDKDKKDIELIQQYIKSDDK
jgi:hypothetical protein